MHLPRPEDLARQCTGRIAGASELEDCVKFWGDSVVEFQRQLGDLEESLQRACRDEYCRRLVSVLVEQAGWVLNSFNKSIRRGHGCIERVVGDFKRLVMSVGDGSSVAGILESLEACREPFRELRDLLGDLRLARQLQEFLARRYEALGLNELVLYMNELGALLNDASTIVNDALCCMSYISYDSMFKSYMAQRVYSKFVERVGGSLLRLYLWVLEGLLRAG